MLGELQRSRAAGRNETPRHGVTDPKPLIKKEQTKKLRDQGERWMRGPGKRLKGVEAPSSRPHQSFSVRERMAGSPGNDLKKTHGAHCSLEQKGDSIRLEGFAVHR